MPFLEGYFAGLALIVLIGPVLFVLVQTTLEHGRPQGFAVAVGIAISDVLAVLLCSLGVATILEEPTVQSGFALAGGLLLVALGARYLLRPSLKAPTETPQRSGLAVAFAKGFSVNFVNPFVFMVWLAIIGAATLRHGQGLERATFLAGTLLGIFTLDTLKVLFAHRVAQLLQPRTLQWVFRVSGVLMLGFGARLGVYALM